MNFERQGSDPEELRPQLFNLIWQVYGNDSSRYSKAVRRQVRKPERVCSLFANSDESRRWNSKMWNTSVPRRKEDK